METSSDAPSGTAVEINNTVLLSSEYNIELSDNASQNRTSPGMKQCFGSCSTLLAQLLSNMFWCCNLLLFSFFKDSVVEQTCLFQKVHL